jgi:hypothetical protein
MKVTFIGELNVDLLSKKLLELDDEIIEQMKKKNPEVWEKIEEEFSEEG